MRLVKFPVILALFSTFILFSLCTAEEKEQTQYFEVKSPIANVYRALDPKSDIIKQVMVGERFELLAQGTSWHNVKIDSVTSGWIENQAGKIVKGKKGFPIISFLFLLLLIGGTGSFVYLRISKTKTTDNEEV